jgi:hypothetical protein
LIQGEILLPAREIFVLVSEAGFQFKDYRKPPPACLAVLPKKNEENNLKKSVLQAVLYFVYIQHIFVGYFYLLATCWLFVDLLPVSSIAFTSGCSLVSLFSSFLSEGCSSASSVTRTTQYSE